MSDYGTMQDRIADELARADLETQIQRSIQSAIKHYERTRFYFNTSVTDTFATVANQEYYGAAANSRIPNLIQIDDMGVTINGIVLPVLAVPFDQMDTAQNGAIKSFPQYFAYYAQQIRLFPMPDQVYTISLAWQYRLTALSADTDTNAWMTDAEELIRTRAECDLLWRVMDDPEKAQIFRLAENEAFSILELETARRGSVQILGTDPAISLPRPVNIVTG